MKSIMIFGYPRANYTPVFELILLHCTGTLIELILDGCDIPVEIESALQPLLLHLKKLILYDSVYSTLFARMLSTWSLKLHTLQIHNRRNKNASSIRFDEILHRSYNNYIYFMIPHVSKNSEKLDSLLKRFQNWKR